jgi:hypothetical protein
MSSIGRSLARTARSLVPDDLALTLTTAGRTRRGSPRSARLTTAGWFA